MAGIGAIAETLLNELDQRPGAREEGGQVLPALLGLVSNRGVEGLINMFQANGLGQQAQSWISTGANLPISETELEQGLGADTVDTMATQAGLPRPAVSQLLTMLLPALIDRLTPEGRVSQGPTGSDDPLSRLMQGFS